MAKKRLVDYWWGRLLKVVYISSYVLLILGYIVYVGLMISEDIRLKKENSNLESLLKSKPELVELIAKTPNNNLTYLDSYPRTLDFLKNHIGK